MKTRDLLLLFITVVILIFYGLFGNWYILLCLVFVPVLYFLMTYFVKSPEGPSVPQNVDELLACYDEEPDALIIADPTRGNEVASVIVVFRGRDMMIIGGQEVKISDVADVTFNNASTPYMVNDYQIVFTLSNPTRLIHVSTGIDAQWAAEVLRQVKEECDL